MIISEQDQNIIRQDSVRQSQDTSIKIIIPADSAGPAGTAKSINSVQAIRGEIHAIADTTTVSRRNYLNEIIHSDTTNRNLPVFNDHSLFFPFSFIGKSENRVYQKTGIITSDLREGKAIPPQPFNDDWIIIIVLASAFIYSTLSVFPGRIFHNVKAFLFFKGIGDPSSRERGIFFQWQTILINIVSFSAAALFAYCTADYYGFHLFRISGILLWLMFFGLIHLIVIIRHMLCSLLGSITGENAVFREYSATVYQSYHVTGFFLLLITVLVSYTTFPAPQTLLYSGIVAVSAAYLLRILRLLLIFLKRNISIFYLILYLCALEFLPALMVLKYLTDLF